MRSVFGLIAAAWFAVQANVFLAWPAIANPGAPYGVDGDPAAVAITMAARAVFIGLALLSLAVVEWGRMVAAVRWFFSREQPVTEAEARA